MKSEKYFIDSNSLPWELVNSNISRKLLNGNASSGPHTAILKSEPRSPDPHRGQYHNVDEEFYCLKGKFTFDGTHWFRKGSYVYFPARYVHGANVHVENGYLVYLRMSGTTTIDFVENPTSDFPYLLEGATSPVKPTVYGRVPMAGKAINAHGVDWLRSRTLKEYPDTGEGTTILNFEPSTSRNRVSLKSTKELELFVLSGTLENDLNESIQHGTYAYFTGKTIGVPLRAVSAGRILISHGSKLDVRVA